MECTRPYDTKNDKSSNIGVLKCTTVGAAALLESMTGNISNKVQSLVEPSFKKEDDTPAPIPEILMYPSSSNKKKRGIGYGACTVLILLVCCIVGTAVKSPTWLEQIMSRINSSGVDKKKETKEPANLTVGSKDNSSGVDKKKETTEPAYLTVGSNVKPYEMCSILKSSNLDKEKNAVIICSESSGSQKSFDTNQKNQEDNVGTLFRPKRKGIERMPENIVGTAVKKASEKEEQAQEEQEALQVTEKVEEEQEAPRVAGTVEQAQQAQRERKQQRKRTKRKRRKRN